MDPAVIDLIRQFGLPTALLLGLIFALWRVGKWFGSTVVEPVVKAHLACIDGLRAGQEQLAESQAKQADALNALATAADKHTENMGRLASNQDRLASVSDQNAAMLRQIVEDRRHWKEQQRRGGGGDATA